MPAAALLVVVNGRANVPNTFMDGDTLTAKSLNDNFTDIDSRLSKLETTYCGTTVTVTGQLDAANGYMAGKTLCQGVAACGAEGHMCTSMEMVNYTSTGGAAPPSGWVVTGQHASVANQAMNDCEGFTKADPQVWGEVWQGNHPFASTCNNTHPVLCCH